MERAVFDTNILISAFLGYGPPFEALNLVYNGKVQLVTSMDLFSELLSVIKRERFGFPKKMLNRIAVVIYETSEFVEPSSKVDVITVDEEDNRILEAALEGRVKYIVSGDKHLLELKKWKGIEILSARDFVEKIFSK
jgi:putative PIN family toxin of toxin-antitoxin system